jgi:hypothetical protein
VMIIMTVRMWGGGGVKAHEHLWLYAPAG